MFTSKCAFEQREIIYVYNEIDTDLLEPCQYFMFIQKDDVIASMREFIISLTWYKQNKKIVLLFFFSIVIY